MQFTALRGSHSALRVQHLSVIKLNTSDIKRLSAPGFFCVNAQFPTKCHKLYLYWHFIWYLWWIASSGVGLWLWSLFTNEGKMDDEMERWFRVPIICGEGGAEVEDKAFGLQVTLRSNPDLWARVSCGHRSTQMKRKAFKKENKEFVRGQCERKRDQRIKSRMKRAKWPEEKVTDLKDDE